MQHPASRRSSSLKRPRQAKCWCDAADAPADGRHRIRPVGSSMERVRSGKRSASRFPGNGPLKCVFRRSRPGLDYAPLKRPQRALAARCVPMPWVRRAKAPCAMTRVSLFTSRANRRSFRSHPWRACCCGSAASLPTGRRCAAHGQPPYWSCRRTQAIGWGRPASSRPFGTRSKW